MMRKTFSQAVGASGYKLARAVSLRSLMCGALMGASVTLSGGAVLAQNGTPPEMRPATDAKLSLVGRGEVYVSPDMATLNMGVTTSGATAVEAMAQNSDILRKVIDQLKQAGIEERYVQTSGLGVSPIWADQDHTKDEAPKIIGYRASNQLDVQIMDLTQLGPILDAALASGANTVNGPSFGLKDMRPLESQAMTAAIQDAYAKAQVMAQAMGMELGDVISVSEGGNSYGAAKMVRAAEFDSATPVQGGEISASASVSMEWQLLP